MFFFLLGVVACNRAWAELYFGIESVACNVCFNEMDVQIVKLAV